MPPAWRPAYDQLRLLLESGVRAPSAENKHHLRFEVRPDAVHLLTTDRPTWATQPHRRYLALCALGAVVENIALASAKAGVALQIAWLPEPHRPDCIARLTWAPLPVDAVPDPLAAAIETRHTNRRFYRRERLAASQLAPLAVAAADIPGAALRWVEQPPWRKPALAALRLAETERFRRKGLHRELFGSIRFEAGWNDATQEWLAPAALEIEGPMRLPFAALRHWPLMRALSWMGSHVPLGVRAGYLPCALSPHLGLVTIEQPGQAVDDADDAVQLLAGGRALQRVWLAAQMAGLAFQPMAAPVALSLQTAGGDWVGEAAQRRLRGLLDALCGDDPSAARGTGADRPARRPVMLFRLGTAARPSVVSGRQPVERYIDQPRPTPGT